MSYIPELLSSGSVTAAATMPVSLVSFFDKYRKLHIDFYGVQVVTTNTNLLIQVSVDGTTYNAGAGAYSYTFAVGATVTTSTGTSIQVASGFSNASNVQCTGYIDISNMNQAVTFPTIHGALQGTANGGTSIFPIIFAGQLLTAQLTKGIQLLSSSGNITGSWALYGFK